MAFQSTDPYMKTMGLQLWTVRNQLEKDTAKTLKAVSDAGYKQVELMKTMGSDQIVKIAKDNGMAVTSGFMEWKAIADPDSEGTPKFDAILEQAKTFGLKHLVFGYIGKGFRETADHFKAHAEAANKAGEKCKKAGIQLCYHNHSFEFAKLKDGGNGFDIFVKEFDKDLCKFELDVFWVKIGGRKPLKVMRELTGRISQVHLKDLKKGASTEHDEGKVPHEAFEELGDGSIGFAKVMEVAKKIGVEQCHVEQDQSPSPIDSIGQSMKHLKSLG